MIDLLALLASFILVPGDTIDFILINAFFNLSSTCKAENPLIEEANQGCTLAYAKQKLA